MSKTEICKHLIISGLKNNTYKIYNLCIILYITYIPILVGYLVRPKVTSLGKVH